MLIDDRPDTETHIVQTPPRRRILLQFLGLLVIPVVIGAGLLTWSDVAEGDDTDSRMLVVDDEGAISLLDSETGTQLYRVPGAVASPDRSALLTTRDAATGGTTLQSHDPATGEVTGQTTLGVDDLTVRTISPDGGAVALLPGPRGRDLYEPEARTTTSLTVAYTDDRPSRTYDLDGNFEPEMFSLDESLLFVLEFTPADAPTGYFVRQLDLESGELVDTGAPEAVLNPKMGGKARAQVLHPEGTHLYTLYTVPGDQQPVHDVEAPPGADPEHWAFIHVIDLAAKTSHCIFLPVPIGTVDEASVGMGASPDGSTLYVADPSTSRVAVVDAIDLEVEEVVRVTKLRDNHARAKVAVAEDGTVYVGNGSMVIELAADTLRATYAWSALTPVPDGIAAADVTALSISGDQTELRVGTPEQITIVDRGTRKEVAVLQPPGDGTVNMLGPPQGSVTEFPLQCAC